MEKISRNSKVTELDSSIKRVIAAYKSYDWTSDFHLTGLFSDLEVDSKKLTTAIMKLKGDSDLDDLDDIRDEYFRNFYYLVFGLRYNPDQVIKEAAEKIFSIIGSKGLGVVDENYSVESSIIESMLEQIDADSMIDNIEVLPGAEVLLDKLRLSQMNFEKAELELETTKAKESQNLSATDIKKEILPLFNGKVLLYLHAMSVVDESTYGEFARTVEQIISDNNITVKKRLAN